MKVALVVPKINSTPLPELGVAYLAGYLRKYNAADVRIFDANSVPGGNDEMIASIIAFGPEVIGLSAGYSANHANYISFLRSLRTLMRETFVVVGGNHATNYAHPFLEHQLADVVVLGEGEATLSELINDISSRRPWRGELGICYYDAHLAIVVRNQPRPYITNLDDIPFPAFDLMPFEFYETVERVLPTMIYRGRGCSWVIQERGCPYSCTFCAVSSTYGKKPRYPSLEYVLRLIEHRLESFGLDHICFWDDVFTFNRERTMALCKEMVSRRLNILWGCQTRVDLVDDELLAVMAEAGCVLIEYGVENVDPEVVRSLRKGVKLNQVSTAIKATHGVAISMQINLMVGNVADTEDTMLSNIRFGREVLQHYNALPCFWVATPLPGTELYDQSVRLGLTGDSFARNTTPTLQMLAGKTDAYLPQRFQRERFNELLKLAWSQDGGDVTRWFGRDRLLLAALSHHGISVADYLTHLFPKGVGNFIESRFFVTGYPGEDLWPRRRQSLEAERMVVA